MGTAQTYFGNSILHQSTGVTYFFATEVEYGYYWNGDPFVVSGGSDVVITKITPEDSAGGRIMHGAMLQPDDGKGNGFDDAAGGYSPTNNVDPAATGKNLIISAGTYPDGASLIKAVSLVDLSLQRDRSEIDKFSVLTIVNDAPPADAFRPPVAGLDKTSHYTLDDLDFSKLQSVAPVVGQQPISDFEYLKEATYLSWWSGQEQLRNFHPNSYHDGYGDYQLDAVAGAFMALHTNYTDDQKLDLYASVVQQGIDYAGGVMNGVQWGPAGGHNGYYKPFVVTAASALNSSTLRDAAVMPGAFSEDGQYTYIVADDIGVEYFESTTNKDPKIGTTYQEAHLGTPEWIIVARNGVDLRQDPSLAASYRWINSDDDPIIALTMEMLGNGEGREIWGNEAYFDYAERIRLIQKAQPNFDGATGGGTHSAEDQWLKFVDAYHDTYSAGANLRFRPEAPQELSVALKGDDVQLQVGGDVLPGSSPVTRVDLRYRGSEDDDWAVIQNFGRSGTISGLSRDEVYFFQSRYVNAVGEGPWSDNRFEVDNGALIDFLKAEGFVTQAQMDAVGGQRQFQKSVIYQDHLRSILNGDEGYEDLADDYVSGTIQLPASGAPPAPEVEPDPIRYPVPDTQPKDPGVTPIDLQPVPITDLPPASPVTTTPLPGSQPNDLGVEPDNSQPLPISDLPPALPVMMDDMEGVDDEPLQQDSSDGGGDFGMLIAFAALVPLLLLFGR